jgi:hypothetical protein
MNIANLTSGLLYRGEVEAKRQTYYVFEGKKGYFIMSLSRSKKNAGNFNFIGIEAAEYVAKRFAGRRKITSREIVRESSEIPFDECPSHERPEI